MHYRPEIDGLRALAVIPVVLFHLGVSCSGGFVGVDVFFVISGFLITRILWSDIEVNEFSIKNFWERRVRRILPALTVMVVATLLAGYRIMVPEDLSELGGASVAQTLLYSNIFYWWHTDYFAGPAEYKPLLHTWSLAVEEQFYLVFPLVLCLFRRVARNKLLAALAVTALLSFLASIYGTYVFPEATFFLLPTRMWELLAGCILALLPNRREPTAIRCNLIAVLGLLGILLPVFMYDKNTQFPGLTAMPPVIGTAAIIFASSYSKKNWLCRVLSLRPLVFVGLLSYSLYLWHWPVIVFTRIHFGHFDWKQKVFAGIVSICFSIASWKFIETPMRRKNFLGSRRALFSLAATVSVGLLMISMTLSMTWWHGFLYPNYSPILASDTEYPGSGYSVSSKVFDETAMPLLGIDFASGGGKRQLDFLVWGDSHAMMLCSTIDRVAKQTNLSGRVVCWGGQVPLPGIDYVSNNSRYTEQLMRFLETNRPRNIILVKRWSALTNGINETEAKYRSDGSCFISNSDIRSTSHEESAEVLRMEFAKFANYCHEAGIKLWILKQVPEISLRHPAKDMLAHSLGRAANKPPLKIRGLELHLTRQKIANQTIDSIKTPSVSVLDPTPYFIDLDGFIAVRSAGRSYYFDEDHLTEAGAALLEPMFFEMFSSIRSCDGEQY